MKIQEVIKRFVAGENSIRNSSGTVRVTTTGELKHYDTVIAKRVEGVQGVGKFLISERRYSSSTSKVQHWLRYEANGQYKEVSHEELNGGNSHVHYYHSSSDFRP